MTPSPDPQKLSDTHLKLAQETARIRWTELRTYYARGQVVAVAPELDLVEVGVQLAQDNKTQFQNWLREKQVFGIHEDQARLWFDQDTELWALVVAPWVLVQEPKVE